MPAPARCAGPCAGAKPGSPAAAGIGIGTGDARPHLGWHRIGAHRAVTAQAHHDDAVSHSPVPSPGTGRTEDALQHCEDLPIRRCSRRRLG